MFTRLVQISDRGKEALALSAAQDLPAAEGMVRIEQGAYTVGLDNPGKDHAPTQQVKLAEFWIDQSEATNTQYAKFLAETERPPVEDWPEGVVPPDLADHPVKGVTWDTAAAFCEWHKKRLPTEAEWEVAARGLDGRLYPWGDKQNAVQLPRSGTYEVGTKLTNQSPFGVLDMAGNVWEWVGEAYAPTAEGNRVLRGGANDFLKDMAYRLQGAPDLPTMIASAGVRCAADEAHVSQEETIAGAGILYQDSFADPASGWPIRAEGDLYFGYHPPDFFHFEIGTPDNYAVISRQPSFSDVTVEADVLVDHTDTESKNFRYGLALRRSGDQYYAFTVSSRRGTWQVLKHTPSGLETLARGTVETLRGIAPQGFTPNESDTIRVDARGPDFVFHINGQVVTQVSDPDFSGGEVGFFVENIDETLAHIHFDSLTIREVEMGTAPEQGVIIEDEFTDPTTGWPGVDEEGAPSRLGYHPPDYYHVEVRAANELAAVSQGQSFTDVTVETAVFVDHTGTDSGDFRYGLALRRSGNRYYAFTVSTRRGAWHVLKHTPAGSETLAEGAVDTLRGFAPQGFTRTRRTRCG